MLCFIYLIFLAFLILLLVHCNILSYFGLLSLHFFDLFLEQPKWLNSSRLKLLFFLWNNVTVMFYLLCKVRINSISIFHCLKPSPVLSYFRWWILSVKKLRPIICLISYICYMSLGISVNSKVLNFHIFCVNQSDTFLY